MTLYELRKAEVDAVLRLGDYVGIHWNSSYIEDYDLYLRDVLFALNITDERPER